jgi:hypothetical protein
VNGRTVGTAQLNLNVRVPDATKAYTLHTIYKYNTVLAIAGDGSASLMF